MTTTIEEVDTDWLTLLDFEAEVPCESVLGCDNTAEWINHFLCCGKKLLLCTPCKNRCLPSGVPDAQCGWCETPGVECTWEPL